MFYFLFLLALVNAGKTLQPIVNANQTSNVVEPKSILDKVVGDPKQFVAEMLNLDPTALRTIISLLEDLLTTSEERETSLNDAVSNADNAVSDAANRVADADDVLTDKKQGVADATAHLTTTQQEAAAAIEEAQAELAAAQQAESEAQGGLDAAKEDHSARVGDKEGAEANLAGEIQGLNHEQQVLRDVIAILEDLHGKNICQDVTIGPQGGNGGSKEVTLPGVLTFCSSEPVNEQDPNWNDAFRVEKTSVVGRVNIIRTDAGTAWGQDLVLSCCPALHE